MKKYDEYNDYELLYLIKDGNENALKYFFQKYDCLITKIAISFYSNGDKLEDLLQEGRMILYDCIKNYNSSYGTTFYTYFVVSLKRKYYKLFKENYYETIIFIDDLNLPEILYDKRNGVADWMKIMFEGTIYYDMYISIFYKNISIKKYAEDNNISYANCYVKYLKMIEFIKKALT